MYKIFFPDSILHQSTKPLFFFDIEHGIYDKEV